METDERVWIKSGSRAADYRYRVILNKARNDCIENLAREGVRRGRRVIVLVERLAHLHALSRRLNDVNHRVACGAVEQEDRTGAMRAMDTGKLPLILANRVFGKGVDIRSVDTIIDGTALPGRNGALQRWGRGSRKTEGKTGLIYIDIADCGNQFADAARSRLMAFREIGCPITDMTWKRNGTAEILDQMEEKLKTESIPDTNPRWKLRGSGSRKVGT
jgi:superfamily II DNA or RNA helicase